MNINRMCVIDLKPGEVVVTATTLYSSNAGSFQDYIIVITDRGTVYKIELATSVFGD